MLGGEALPGAALDGWRRRHPSVNVISVYGPTEVTVNCAEHVIPPGEPTPSGLVPLGLPMAGRTRMYVLDAQLRPLPAGSVGELYVSCTGLARGYLGQPGLTATRFVADPFAGAGSRMYRTGDLASRREDGIFDFAGRVDDQVKLRGYRIELGEIESVLASHPAVSRAAAALREDRPGDQRIVAYLLAKDGASLDQASLRGHAAAALPDYMVPSAFVTLDELPLTTNGKLDRASLPAPTFAAPTFAAPTFAAPTFAATDAARDRPQTETQRRLCELFADVLGLPGVGADDDFFELGGHSLLVTRLVSRIRSALEVELSVRAVFEAPTAAALAQRLDSAGPARPVMSPGERPARIPLSPAQQRLRFVHRLEPSALYNMPRVVRLDGTLDRAAFRAAVGDVVARHESLRTLITDADPEPALRIVDAAEATPVVRFVSASAAGLSEVLLDGVRHVFDLGEELPFRVTVVSLGPAEHVLLLLAHHIAADGWSFTPIARDLSQAYAARCRGQAPAWPALPAQYADFAIWQRQALGDVTDPGSAAAHQLSFWRLALAGLPRAIDLPFDRPRSALPAHLGGIVPFTLAPRLHRDVIALARRSGSTVFMVMQAAIAVLLTRLGAGTDIPIGTAIAGRADHLTEDLVGCFVNTLALRTDTSGDPGFAALLSRVRDADLAAYANSDVPFERVVEAVNPGRSLAHHPLFQVMLTFQNDVAPGFALRGLRASACGKDVAGTGLARFDLSFDMRERPGAAGIEASLEYASDVLDAGTAAAIAARLTRLLRAVIASPGLPLSKLKILLPGERHTVLRRWNGTARPVSAATLPELVAASVRRAPHAPAIRCGEERLTYAELDDRVNRLARVLAARGIGPERFAAVLLPKSADLVVALLAVMRAGGAYLVLEPSYPAGRIEAMLGQVGPALVLSRAALAGRLRRTRRCWYSTILAPRPP